MRFFLLIATVICLARGKDERVAFRIAMSKYAVKDHIDVAESFEMRQKRYKSFLKFHAMVEEINNDDSLPYQAADNFMSILTDEERKLHLGVNITGHLADFPYDDDSKHVAVLSSSDIPEKRDFSQVISDVKDQGTCGSCWTFGATGALEGEIYFKTGTKKVSLSEQEYMECVDKSDACRGGWPTNCYTYSKKNDRIAPNSAYPYLERPRDRRKCYADSTPANALVDNNVRVVGSINFRGEQQLLERASKHIISVAIHANYRFQGYTKGIYIDDKCNEGVNHAVNVVGYGKDSSSGRKYWKLRNSWGQDWGEKGYIFMDREKSDMCKISTYPHYPNVQCRDGKCVAPNPDDGDSSSDEEKEEEMCFSKHYLTSCHRNKNRVKRKCKNAETCIIAKVGNKCHMSTNGANSGFNYIEVATKCGDTNGPRALGLSGKDICYDKVFFGSVCKKTRDEALKVCKENVKANECMILFTGNNKCFYATNGGSSGKNYAEKAKKCQEACNTAGGMVLCSDCNCCKHKHFCSDTSPRSSLSI